MNRPNVIVLAGPNGAGKTTAAPRVLGEALGVGEFVNADVIEKEISSLDRQHRAIEAGRIMLRRMHELGTRRENFAFETTLASRSFRPFLRDLLEQGYAFRLLFFSLTSADLAVARVQQRVREGGHSVPEDTIRRRFQSGPRNFFEIYLPMATSWRLYENSYSPVPHLIARCEEGEPPLILDEPLWNNRVRYGR